MKSSSDKHGEYQIRKGMPLVPPKDHVSAALTAAGVGQGRRVIADVGAMVVTLRGGRVRLRRIGGAGSGPAAGSGSRRAEYDLPPENESRSNVTLQRENEGYWAEEMGQVSRCEPSVVRGPFCGGGTAFETLTSTEHSARG